MLCQYCSSVKGKCGLGEIDDICTCACHARLKENSIRSTAPADLHTLTRSELEWLCRQLLDDEVFCRKLLGGKSTDKTLRLLCDEAKRSMDLNTELLWKDSR